MCITSNDCIVKAHTIFNSLIIINIERAEMNSHIFAFYFAISCDYSMFDAYNLYNTYSKMDGSKTKSFLLFLIEECKHIHAHE